MVELGLLWRREMVIGTYMPRWVKADIAGHVVRAIAFVVNRKKPGYTGRLDDQQIVSIALKACGHYGTCADYLVNTATSLEVAGIADPRLSRLAKMLILVNVDAVADLETGCIRQFNPLRAIVVETHDHYVIVFRHCFTHRTAAHHIHMRAAVGLVAQRESDHRPDRRGILRLVARRFPLALDLANIVDNPALGTRQAHRGAFAIHLRPKNGAQEQRSGGDEAANQSGNLVHGM
jgi:hypothetical protein